MRFEKDSDLKREDVAIKTFCSEFNLSYLKLGVHDVDFKVYNGDKIAYVEVKGRNRIYEYSFPLPVAARKMLKLVDKESPSIILWDCLDCIIYGNTKDIVGTVRVGGRKPREGSHNDNELMLYYDNQVNLKIIFK